MKLIFFCHFCMYKFSYATENVYLEISSIQETDILVWENLQMFLKKTLWNVFENFGQQKSASLNLKIILVSEVFKYKGSLFGIVSNMGKVLLYSRLSLYYIFVDKALFVLFNTVLSRIGQKNTKKYINLAISLFLQL